MNRIARLSASVIACVLLAGCASGPTYSQLQSSATQLAPNTGRIYIYRTSALGAAIQPSVKVDGMVVGDAVPQGYFYIDRPPGNYMISTETEVDRIVSLTLEPGQIRYVRLDPSFGFVVGHISPILVDTAKAQDEIKDCHYTGKS
jgi:hypothetical protein